MTMKCVKDKTFGIRNNKIRSVWCNSELKSSPDEDMKKILARANDMIGEQDYQCARSYLASALKFNPDNAQLLNKIMIASAMIGNIKETEYWYNCLKNIGWKEKACDGRMLQAYFAAGQVEKAEQFFEKINNNEIILANIMILGYINNGMMEKADTLFSSMKSCNISTYYVMFKAYCEKGMINEAEELLNKMEAHEISNEFTYGKIMDTYYEHNMFEKVCATYESLDDDMKKCWSLCKIYLEAHRKMKHYDYVIKYIENSSCKTISMAIIKAYCYKETGQYTKLTPLLNLILSKTRSTEHYTRAVCLAVFSGLVNEKDKEDYKKALNSALHTKKQGNGLYDVQNALEILEKMQ